MSCPSGRVGGRGVGTRHGGEENGRWTANRRNRPWTTGERTYRILHSNSLYVPFPFSSLGSVFHPSPRSERNGTEHERSEASGMTWENGRSKVDRQRHRDDRREWAKNEPRVERWEYEVHLSLYHRSSCLILYVHSLVPSHHIIFLYFFNFRIIWVLEAAVRSKKEIISYKILIINF